MWRGGLEEAFPSAQKDHMILNCHCAHYREIAVIGLDSLCRPPCFHRRRCISLFLIIILIIFIVAALPSLYNPVVCVHIYIFYIGGISYHHYE